MVDHLPRELREMEAPTARAVQQGDESAVRIEMKLGKETLADIEFAVIEEVMRLVNYNKSLAAKHLGLTRFALDRRLKKMPDQ